MKTGISLIGLLLVAALVSYTPVRATDTEDSTMQTEKRVFNSPDDVTEQDIANDIKRGRAYFLVLLKRGEANRSDSAQLDSLQMQHLKRIFYLKSQGKLAIAGPVASNVPLRGIFIFAVETEEEVKALIAEDALIKNGYLVPEIYPWFGLSGEKLP